MTPPTGDGAPDPADASDVEGPLVDRSWSAGLPPEVATSFTVRALDRAERLRNADPDAPGFAAEAHQVRGSAGTVGLPAISEVAGDLEDGAASGSDLRSLMGKYGRVLDATRRELVRLGVVRAG